MAWRGLLAKEANRGSELLNLVVVRSQWHWELWRSTVNSKVYETVTSQVIAALESGVVPWRKPWATAPPPINAVSKRPYRGVNLLLLGMSRFGDHRWITLRQANELGGRVLKGEKASIAIFWKRTETRHDEGQEKESVRTIPLLRHYHVFNVEQCDNLGLSGSDRASVLRDEDRIEAAEAVVAEMPNPPSIREGGSAAWYRPSDDLVQVPPISSFETPDDYYATLFHELGHSTGHPTRLARPEMLGEIQYGSGDYGREELVAELASAFVCASIGLDNSLVENSARYIDGWLQSLNRDQKLLLLAAGQAQRASDFIRAIVSKGSEA